MPGALVAALAAPLHQLQSLVGPGSADAATGDLASVLRSAGTALQEVSTAAGQSWRGAAAHWTGSGAEAAGAHVATTIAGTEHLAEEVRRLGSSTDAASAAVAGAHRRLRDIVESFEARAATLEPYLDSPGVIEELVAEARRSLADAVAVVDDLRAELGGHSVALAAPASPASAPGSTTPAPGSTTPAGITAPLPSPGGFGGGAPLSPPGGGAPLSSPGGGAPLSSPGGGAPLGSPGGGAGGLSSLLRDVAALSPPEATVPTPDAAAFGDGVAVRLPDGSTAMAPNATAASAVRHALTQLGVPYDWGGTTPGVGLDCSGLTQWAYAEAGLNIPRLAQEQDVGGAVAAGDLRPGDLAVWDGHVAMIVGNGQMIEAGDPVKLSPIRTMNAGQGFQGFWRPTA